MSTNPRPRNEIRTVAIITLAALCAACAGPAPEPGHHFSEVRLHRAAPPPAPAYLEARTILAAPAPASPASRDPTAVAGRVRALLREDGFTVETRSEQGADVLAATRMGAPEALRQEAACRLQAMHRPDFSASDLSVRLDGGGAAVTSRFVLVDTNLISGDLTRQTCRSNGVLEAAVRRAAGS